MRLPWISAKVYRELTPKAVKMLCIIAARGTRGTLIIRLVDLAPQAAMCETTARRAIRELGEAGIIQFESSTQGYRIYIPYTKRFTFVPPERLHLLMALQPTSVKVFVAICRALKPSRMIRMLIRTIADRVGRSRRTVQLALAEIKLAGLSWTIRTGRSNVIVVDHDQGHLFEPEIAPRSRILLRLLKSTPRHSLSQTLGHPRRSETEYAVRDSHATMALKSDEQWIAKSLTTCGVSRDERNVMLTMYTLDELVHALDLLAGRRVKDACAFIKSAISREWCAWAGPGGMEARHA